MILLQLLAGLAFLIFGAELLVRGASNLAAQLGIPSVIIGLTVVALGTSSPEFAVSVQAATSGNANIALGNVVGSNILNVLFILGLSAAIIPLAVSSQLIRVDVPIMIVATLVTYAMSANGSIGRIEGTLLLLGLLLYVGLLIHFARKAGIPTPTPLESGGNIVRYSWPRNIAFVVSGLALLVLGSNLLVKSAVTIATHFGVSDLVIGLTIIAGGTSLPEVVTSIVASVRGERDIAVANVVGSNSFNLLGVLGLSAMLSPTGIEVNPSALQFDIPVMVAATIACLPIFMTGKTIERWEGMLFLTYYVAYTLYLVLDAQGHESLATFRVAFQWVVLPLTIMTIIVTSVRGRRP